MSHFGGGLRRAVGAGGVGIPSNLLISSGCLGLSGLNLTDCACGGCGGGGLLGLGGGLLGLGGGLLGLGGLVHGAGGGLGAGTEEGICGVVGAGLGGGLGLGSGEVGLVLS